MCNFYLLRAMRKYQKNLIPGSTVAKYQKGYNPQIISLLVFNVPAVFSPAMHQISAPSTGRLHG
jgi:hypothetical protein